MDRMRKVVASGLAMLAVAAAVAVAPMAARAQGSNVGPTGGATLNPAYQVGNAQGDGNGQ